VALSPERDSARMSEIKNDRLDLIGQHSKCNHLMTLGLKGLIAVTTIKCNT